MAKTIKLDDELMELVGREADMMSRSLAGQVRHWVRIGMSVEKSRFFDQSRIVEALSGKLSPDLLTAAEQESYVDAIFDASRNGTAEQARFFEQRRIKGLGAGMRDGKLAHEAGRAE